MMFQSRDYAELNSRKLFTSRYYRQVAAKYSALYAARPRLNINAAALFWSYFAD